jgi:hypothetical protein
MAYFMAFVSRACTSASVSTTFPRATFESCRRLEFRNDLLADNVFRLLGERTHGDENVTFRGHFLKVAVKLKLVYLFGIRVTKDIGDVVENVRIWRNGTNPRDQLRCNSSHSDNRNLGIGKRNSLAIPIEVPSGRRKWQSTLIECIPESQNDEGQGVFDDMRRNGISTRLLDDNTSLGTCSRINMIKTRRQGNEQTDRFWQFLNFFLVAFYEEYPPRQWTCLLVPSFPK